MALKRKITKEAFDKLSKDLQAEYVEKDGEFILDVDGGNDDDGALRRAKDREVQARKDAEKRAKEAEEKLAEIEGDDARKKGDIETLEKKWKGDLEAERAAHKATTDKYQGAFKKSLVDAKSVEIATAISKAPKLLSRVIRDRLTVDFEGDEPVTKVLDAAGKVSDMTLDDLQKEIVANPDYKDIILASKASGGAGKTSQKPGGGAPTQPEKTADLASMTPQQLADHVKAQKAASETE